MNRIYIIGTFLCVLLLWALPTEAQKKKSSKVTVEGIVIDESSKPMQGISVRLQEKSTESLTGKDGRFYMLVDPDDVLIVNEKGYRPIVTSVLGKESHTLKLVKYRTHEDEIIGVSYGEQSKRSVTGAISSIGTQEIEKNAVTSIEQAMNGTLSGLYSLKNVGDRFGKSNYAFYVRGKATNANALPLILVDDVEANIDLMDFNEVESISVLKDASALAMYGMRGANGVILIKTKHGSEVKHSINVDIRAGVQVAERMSDRLNAYQYATLYNEGLTNDGRQPMYDPSVYQQADRDPFLHPDTNFKDEFLGNTSPFQHYNFSASGGNALARYFVTAGYMKQEGLFKQGGNKNYERFNFRSNIDMNPIRGMLVNVLVSAGIDKHNVPYRSTTEDAMTTTNNIFNTLMTLPANAFPVFNRDGSLGGSPEYKTNPYGLFNRAGSRKDETRLLNVMAKVKYDLDMIAPGLSADAFYGFENYNMQYVTVSRSYAVFQEKTDGTYTQFGTDNNKDSRNANQMGGFYRYTNIGAGLTYNRALANEQDLSLRLFYNHSVETAGGDVPDYKYQGLAFRGQYGWKKRYYAELTAAYQGSNYYTSGQRSGLFPAVGLAWVMSDEDWMQGLTAIDYLKLRTSYGMNGNDKTNGRRFPYRQEFTAGGGYSFGNPSGGADGSTAGTLANRNESWEKAYKWNIGFDIELWKGLSLTADYFNEQRRDVLVGYGNVIPSLIGITLSKYNAGHIQNQGVDMNLMYSKQYTNGGFFVGGNMLWAKNKIIDLKETAYQYEHQYQKGHAIGTRFGFQSGGYYTTAEQLKNAPVASFGTPALGDVIYKDQNGDKILDEVDKVALGNTFPELIYGLTLGGNYKGFDLQCNLEGSSQYTTHFVPSKFTPYVYNNRWDPATPTLQTLYPRMSISSSYSTQTSEFWQEDVNMLRISSAELGYTLPKKLVQKIHLSSVRLYVNGNNLFTFSDIRDGRNPEALNAGYSEYPLLRTVSFGISLKL